MLYVLMQHFTGSCRNGVRWNQWDEGKCPKRGECERIPGRHGLFFAFRTRYDRVEVRP